MKIQNRREFIKFLGNTALVGLGTGAFGFEACKSPILTAKPPKIRIKGIEPSIKDDIVLAENLSYHVIARWDDAISAKDTFGFNNDYVAFIPLKGNDDGLLWVNHEYTDPLFVSGYDRNRTVQRTKEQVDKEMYSVGGTIMRVRRDKLGKWVVVKDDPYNRRITAKTEIPFHWDTPIAGKNVAIGTFANCSGGVTPWGTILTCEENYDMYYGETSYADPNKPTRIPSTDYNWEKFYDYPPEHYGWVTEIDPKTGKGRKLVALGRCAHEAAKIWVTPDKRLVVYTGDDANDQCIYKFISAKPNSLKEGTLYVADTINGKWLSLNYDEQPILRKHFKNQTEVLIRLREAADLVGGTKQDRPEDIEFDPLTGDIFIALTNNKAKNNYFGSILKIKEGSKDKTSLVFESETFIAGGEATGFACPDNMTFDPNGNLWFTCDVSGTSMHKPPYTAFGNNALFVVPRAGEQAGQAIRMASSPIDAEFTGPYFSPDGKTLFLCVQHPGEGTIDINVPTSRWPDFGNSIPRPSLIAIEGAGLYNFTK